MSKNYFWILFTAMIIASCGESKKEEAGSLTDKKVELQKLKDSADKINDRITKLESEIRAQDPTALAAAAKLVVVTPLDKENFSHFIELQGRIDAQNISYVAPPNGLGGVITQLYVRQGQYVKKGQVIARMDDKVVRIQAEPLRVQLKTAEDTYRRLKNLWDQGIGAYQNVLTAKTQMETLEQQIANVQTQAALYTVTAPVSGVIDQLNLRIGEMLLPQQNPAAPQIRIVNTGDLKAVANVPENYLGRVNVGSDIEVVLPEENNRVLKGKINVVQKVIDPTNRSFTIEAKIPSDPSLKPNQVAKIKILDYTAPNVMVVPLNVVQSDEKGKYVYVMEKEANRNVARKKSVIVGESYGANIEVKSGLNGGEQLITEGYQNLYEGQVITTDLKG